MEVPNQRAANITSSSKFKWKIENISTLDEENQFSPIFTIGPHKWQLLAFRKGSNVDDYFSVYVVAVECTNSRYARFSIAVVGQTTNTFKKDTEGSMLCFTEDESDWGFDDFIKFKELIDPINGYIVDDACTFEVELFLNLARNSVEELVSMEFMESAEEKNPVMISTLLASTSVSTDNDLAFICAFCQTSKESEGSGIMLHFVNGEEVVEDEVSGPNVIHVHRKCIEWVPQVYYVGETLFDLEKELAKASKLKCSSCGLKGAALGCSIRVCRNIYHFPCAFGTAGFRRDDEVRQILCPSHSGMQFPHEEGKKLAKDDSAAVQRKQETDRGKHKEGENSIKIGQEAIQDREEFIESGLDAVQHAERVTENKRGTVRRYSQSLTAAAEREKTAESGQDAVQDGEEDIQNSEEAIHGKLVIEKLWGTDQRCNKRIRAAAEREKAGQSCEILDGKVVENSSAVHRESEQAKVWAAPASATSKLVLCGSSLSAEAKDNTSAVHRESGQAKVWAAPASATSKLVLCGSSLSAEENHLLANFSKISGITISVHWKPNVTHVIASTDEKGACKRTLRYLKAILDGKWVLKMDWIKACTEAMDLVYEEPYEVGLDNRGCRDGPRNGRLRVSDGAPKLFSGLQFCFSGDFVPSYRESLEELVLAAGALVLTSNSLLSRSSDEGECSSRTLVVYSLEVPPYLKSTEELSKVIMERRTEAEALAKQCRAVVIGHKWLLQSVAMLKVEAVP